MATKKDIQLIRSLRQKKYRFQRRMFTVEGVKSTGDFIAEGYRLRHLLVREERYLETFPGAEVAGEALMRKLSSFKNPSPVLAVFEMPEAAGEPEDRGVSLVLDDIRDPGNLGTMIRLADWFGVRNIICSPATVDMYNPKVVQSSMGSVARMQVVYLDIEEYIRQSKRQAYITALQGDNIYNTTPPEDALIILGNEAGGVRESLLENTAYKRISIPKFPGSKAESLNVATAAAVVLGVWGRNRY